jgi:hypothetical protein
MALPFFTDTAAFRLGGGETNCCELRVALPLTNNLGGQQVQSLTE